MRKLLAVLAAAALLAALVAGPASGAKRRVKVSWKNPTSKTVKVRKGGVVKWVWADGLPHNVKGPGFRSKTSGSRGFVYKHRFRKRGTFKIICEVHPTTMRTTVKVR